MRSLPVRRRYTGQALHLCHLPSMWEEYLSFDTLCTGGDGGSFDGGANPSAGVGSHGDQGAGAGGNDDGGGGGAATLARIVTALAPGTKGYVSSGIAGVSNVGEDWSWTGHPLSAANT